MTKVFSLLLLATLASCTSLNSHQKSEYKEWQASSIEIQEKNPATAAALNILPGIGDFYNGNIGLGVVNLLTWPASILWAPVGGATGAEEVNYYSTKSSIDKLEKNKKITQQNLDEALYLKTISGEDHIAATRKLALMDLKDFKSPLTARDLVPVRYPANKK